MPLFYPNANYKHDNNVCRFMLLAFSEFLKGVATEEDDAGDTYYVTQNMRNLWQGTNANGLTALTNDQLDLLLDSISAFTSRPIPRKSTRRAKDGAKDLRNLHYVLKEAKMFKAAAALPPPLDQAIQDDSRPDEYNLALLPYDLKTKTTQCPGSLAVCILDLSMQKGIDFPLYTQNDNNICINVILPFMIVIRSCRKYNSLLYTKLQDSLPMKGMSCTPTTDGGANCTAVIALNPNGLKNNNDVICDSRFGSDWVDNDELQKALTHVAITNTGPSKQRSANAWLLSSLLGKTMGSIEYFSSPTQSIIQYKSLAGAEDDDDDDDALPVGILTSSTSLKCGSSCDMIEKIFLGDGTGDPLIEGSTDTELKKTLRDLKKALFTTLKHTQKTDNKSIDNVKILMKDFQPSNTSIRVGTVVGFDTVKGAEVFTLKSNPAVSAAGVNRSLYKNILFENIAKLVPGWDEYKKVNGDDVMEFLKAEKLYKPKYDTISLPGVSIYSNNAKPLVQENTIWSELNELKNYPSANETALIHETLEEMEEVKAARSQTVLVHELKPFLAKVWIVRILDRVKKQWGIDPKLYKTIAEAGSNFLGSGCSSGWSPYSASHAISILEIPQKMEDSDDIKSVFYSTGFGYWGTAEETASAMEGGAVSDGNIRPAMEGGGIKDTLKSIWGILTSPTQGIAAAISEIFKFAPTTVAQATHQNLQGAWYTPDAPLISKINFTRARLQKSGNTQQPMQGNVLDRDFIEVIGFFYLPADTKENLDEMLNNQKLTYIGTGNFDIQIPRSASGEYTFSVGIDTNLLGEKRYSTISNSCTRDSNCSAYTQELFKSLVNCTASKTIGVSTPTLCVPTENGKKYEILHLPAPPAGSDIYSKLTGGDLYCGDPTEQVEVEFTQNGVQQLINAARPEEEKEKSDELTWTSRLWNFLRRDPEYFQEDFQTEAERKALEDRLDNGEVRSATMADTTAPTCDTIQEGGAKPFDIRCDADREELIYAVDGDGTGLPVGTPLIPSPKPWKETLDNQFPMCGKPQADDVDLAIIFVLTIMAAAVEVVNSGTGSSESKNGSTVGNSIELAAGKVREGWLPAKARPGEEGGEGGEEGGEGEEGGGDKRFSSLVKILQKKKTSGSDDLFSVILKLLSEQEFVKKKDASNQSEKWPDGALAKTTEIWKSIQLLEEEEEKKNNLAKTDDNDLWTRTGCVEEDGYEEVASIYNNTCKCVSDGCKNPQVENGKIIPRRLTRKKQDQEMEERKSGGGKKNKTKRRKKRRTKRMKRRRKKGKKRTRRRRR